MPVRAQMPNADFKREWMKQNPDLTCVQRYCHLRVDPILTASHQYGFSVTHNDQSFTLLGSDAPKYQDIPEYAIHALAKRLQESRHAGDPDPADEFLIVRD